MKVCALYLSVAALGVAGTDNPKLTGLNWEQNTNGNYQKRAPTQSTPAKLGPIYFVSGQAFLWKTEEVELKKEKVQIKSVTSKVVASSIDSAPPSETFDLKVELDQNFESVKTFTVASGDASIETPVMSATATALGSSPGESLAANTDVTFDPPLIYSPNILLVYPDWSGKFSGKFGEGDKDCEYEMETLTIPARGYVQSKLKQTGAKGGCPKVDADEIILFENLQAEAVPVPFAPEQPGGTEFQGDEFKSDEVAAAKALKLNQQQRIDERLATSKDNDPFAPTPAGVIVAGGDKKSLFYMMKAAVGEKFAVKKTVGDATCEQEGDTNKMKEAAGCESPKSAKELTTTLKCDDDTTVTITKEAQVFVIGKKEMEYADEQLPFLEREKITAKKGSTDVPLTFKSIKVDVEDNVTLDAEGVAGCKGKVKFASDGMDCWLIVLIVVAVLAVVVVAVVMLMPSEEDDDDDDVFATSSSEDDE
jgi:hypothetical protein